MREHRFADVVDIYFILRERVTRTETRVCAHTCSPGPADTQTRHHCYFTAIILFQGYCICAQLPHKAMCAVFQKPDTAITTRSEKGETAILPDLAFLEDSTTTIQDGV